MELADGGRCEAGPALSHKRGIGVAIFAAIASAGLARRSSISRSISIENRDEELAEAHGIRAAHCGEGDAGFESRPANFHAQGKFDGRPH